MKKIGLRVSAVIMSVMMLVTTIFGGYSKVYAGSLVEPIVYETWQIISSLLSLVGVGVVVGSSGTMSEIYEQDVQETARMIYNKYADEVLSADPSADISLWDELVDSFRQGSAVINDREWSGLRQVAEEIVKGKSSSGGDVVLEPNIGELPSDAYIPDTPYYTYYSETNGYQSIFKITPSPSSSDKLCFYNDGASWMEGYHIIGYCATFPFRIEFYKVVNGNLGYQSYQTCTQSIDIDGVSVYGFNSISIPDDMIYSCSPYPVFGNKESARQYVSGAIDLPVGPDVPYEDYTTVGGLSGIYDRDKNLGAYDIYNVGTTTVGGELADEHDRVVGVAGTDVLEKWLNGDLTWDQLMDLLGVIPVDKVGDQTVADNPADSKPIEEAFPDSETGGDYTVPGVISTLFPFCIPFDLIHLFEVLDAPAVPPRFEIPLHAPEYGLDHTFVVDLSQFDSVAQIFRLLEVLVFILGLILITRGIIKG